MVVGAGPRIAELARAVGAAAARDAPRRVLWLPVALAVGIGVYFALPTEPPPLLGPAAVAAAVGLAIVARRRDPMLWVSLLLIAAAVGFTAAGMRTRALSTVMLQHEAWVDVEGRVTAIERRPAQRRLTLREVTGRGPGGPLPAGVRVTVAGSPADGEVLRIGDRVRLRASLRPPAAPVAPGAFDFQRDAYFRGVGAVGFAVSRPLVVDPAPPGLTDGVWAAVDRLRDVVAGRIRDGLAAPAGPVAAAMLVGDRAGIDGATDEVFRETGLTHLLSISGLHMGMAAGAVFGAVRFALAAWPAVALRRPVKKWAAATALAATAFYLLLSGAPVPAQRAFTMTGLMLVAVLLDRDASSLYLVAWAAAVVLLLAPESLTGPSFQLSFAAVIALVAAWEAVSRRRRLRPSGGRGPAVQAARYVAGVAATSVVASVATAPIIAHHFQQVPVLGAVANLAAVPLTAFVTMPAGAVALAAMPLGLEVWPLVVMGWGIDATLWVAARVAEGPMTAIGVPAIGVGSLVWMTLGSLWMALWRSVVRWLGLAGLVIGLATAVLQVPPDALVSDDGELMAVQAPGENWLLSSDRGGGRFLRDAWRRRWGGAEAVSFARADSGEGLAGFACDGLGCVLGIGGRLLALPSSPEAAREDCLNADVVVTRIRLRGGCREGVLVVDRDALRHGGAHAIWLDGERIRVRSANELRGRRPWVVVPPPRNPPPRNPANLASPNEVM